MADKDSKTEKATDKRKKDELKKGNLFQSKDLASALGLLFVANLFKSFMGPIINFLKGSIVLAVDDLTYSKVISTDDLPKMMQSVVQDILIIVVPVCFASILASFILLGVQTRFRITFSKIKPKFERMNPLQGIKKMFAGRSAIELGKSSIKIGLILTVVWGKIEGALGTITNMPFYTIEDSLSFIGITVADIVITICTYMVVFGIADYAYQMWDYGKNIRMSKQELKEEFKQTEGNPQIKSRIKSIQRSLANRRMMQNVPKATVVIRNPTHYAVALKYVPAEDDAPKVIAKGKDIVALKIIEIAEKHNIDIMENRPLARGLYEAAEIDQTIPEEYFKAVADVLAFFYRLRNSKRQKK